jgi:aconitate hydratase
VSEVAGAEISQVVIGSSANPGFRDFAMASKLVEGRQTHPRVSFDVNPTSRQILEELADERLLVNLVRAGARLHQAGCMGCIGMGQAPATGQISLRTMPRNFPGRSGVKDDRVYLCSPETATASALTGRITDPRDLEELYGMSYPKVGEPAQRAVNTDMLVAPPASEEAAAVALIKSPNIVSLPELDPLPDILELPVLLKVPDNISTDEIMPAGQRVLPYRSNIPAIAEFVFAPIDETYPSRAKQATRGHCVVGGTNYGQGSSREHAAIAPRFLGLRAVIAKDYARIHWQNLPNFGVLPLSFADPGDYERVDEGDVIVLDAVREAITGGDEIRARNTTKGAEIVLRHDLSPRQVEMVLAGGLINVYRRRFGSQR